MVLANASNEYAYLRVGGTSVKPKPGRSGAITRYRSARRGIRSRNMNDEAGKPWSKRTTAPSGGPGSREKTRIPSPFMGPEDVTGDQPVTGGKRRGGFARRA